MSYFSTASASAKSETGFLATRNAPLRPNDNDFILGRRPPSRRSQRSVPSPLKAAAILVGFLPIPPILALIYLACGHAILRAAHSVHFRAVPLISSVRAAAAGGAILALPLAVLLYLLLFPTRPPDPEDFFDDDEDTGEIMTYGSYAVCAVLLLTLGTITGALGTVCLPADNLLSAAQAAEAGIVGGVVLCGAAAMVALTAFFFWWDCCRPNRGTPAE
ncbi:hypothetical protein B0H11DRAFT_399030 [Mycena galericulata]|nr:hypothetical protein B0H11DRAFT_399030 [Mycena galericulata]